MRQYKFYIDKDLEKQEEDCVSKVISKSKGWSVVRTITSANAFLLGPEASKNPLTRHKIGIFPTIALGGPDTPAEFSLPSFEEEEFRGILKRCEPILDKIQALLEERGKIEEDPYYRVLAYIWSRGGVLNPRIDRNLAKGFAYPYLDFTDGTGSSTYILDFLETSGYISSVPYDFYQSCPECGSILLLFRDGCVNCGSSQLQESNIVHHFKCGYQASEEEFRVFHLNNISELVCPKCENKLIHYGVDYDKPGILEHCLKCDFQSSGIEVYGKCVSCGAECKAEDSPKIRLRSYQITKKGEKILFIEGSEAFNLEEISGDYIDILPLNIFIITVKKIMSLRNSINTQMFKIQLKSSSKITKAPRRSEGLIQLGKEFAHKVRPADSVSYYQGALYVFLAESKFDGNGEDILLRSKKFDEIFDDKVIQNITVKEIDTLDFIQEVSDK